jgi:long-chain acyl-CoA synthetase
MKPTLPLTEVHDRFTTWEGALSYLEERYAERSALEIKRGKEWSGFSYRELCGRSRALASLLAARGLGKGERVAILGESSPAWATAFLGAAAAGAVVVPLDSKLQENEIEPLIAHAEPRFVFASASYLEMARRLSPNVIPFSEIEALPLASSVEGLAAGAGKAADPLLIVYTSGTSGQPKGVQLSTANILFDIQAQFRVLPTTGTDTYLSILPLNHLFELTCGLLRPLFSGSTVYYSNSLMPAEIKGILFEKRIKSMLTVPLFLRALKKSIERELNSSPERRKYFKVATAISKAIPFQKVRRKVFAPVLKSFGGRLDVFVCGGAALERDVAEFFARMGIHVLQGYGLTETSPTSTVNTFRANRHGSVGKPIPGSAVRIAAPNAQGEGEVLIRGPHVMLGYFKRDDLTRDAIDSDGWFHTGDLGRVDRRGYLHITGRQKELIVLPNGKKVAPEEVEQGFAGSLAFKELCVLSMKAEAGLKKGVEEICVIAVPSDELRAEISLLASDRSVQESMISERLQEEIRKLSQSMASYKRPSTLVIYSGELPKTTTRKVKRHEVRTLLKSNADLRFETLST